MELYTEVEGNFENILVEGNKMPRYSRRLSQSGIYHAMVRGINKMPIFLDREDNTQFIDTLIKMKAQGEYTLYAYCLMNNHAHLLIEEGEESLSNSMKRIGVSYSYYFNKKYQRVGHVFQGRFRSECIETDDYLLSCIRYIHNNPVKANMVADPGQYKWTSYNIYTGRAENQGELISPGPILEMFSKYKDKSIEEFIKFTSSDSEDDFMDIKEDIIMNEREKLIVTKKIFQKYQLELGSLSKHADMKTRSNILREIKDETNASIREMEKLTGLGKSTISRILRE